MLPITSFFAGLFALYFVRLAFDVIRLRKSHRVSLGAGGVSDLEKAIRAHGNFAEYVPLGLILMGLLESQGARPVLLLICGALLAVGRLLHAQAIKGVRFKQRVWGMMLTFVPLVILAIFNLVSAARNWMA
jgi:uncharacterized membrane protein YecN with MAPEG domain